MHPRLLQKHTWASCVICSTSRWRDCDASRSSIGCPQKPTQQTCLQGKRERISVPSTNYFKQSRAEWEQKLCRRDNAPLHESGTSIGKEARSSLRLAWPTVVKPRSVAVRKGPGGLGSCWEGKRVQPFLSWESRPSVNGCCARIGYGMSGTRHANLRRPPWCVWPFATSLYG